MCPRHPAAVTCHPEMRIEMQVDALLAEGVHTAQWAVLPTPPFFSKDDTRRIWLVVRVVWMIDV